ncbi:hypothetical protein MNBD_GAMMA20-1250 [hydrothermal vent metagenome]|uniref:Uncharacterized protein n=1 Tax=hydrothermal vent metagenome TaxID=652676 RepID=A0A3B1A887_9ZZZZ
MKFNQPTDHGIFITAISWEYALWIRAYALGWFLINDAVKIWTYRLLRREGVA